MYLGGLVHTQPPEMMDAQRSHPTLPRMRRPLEQPRRLVQTPALLLLDPSVGDQLRAWGGVECKRE